MDRFLGIRNKEYEIKNEKVKTGAFTFSFLILNFLFLIRLSLSSSRMPGMLLFLDPGALTTALAQVVQFGAAYTA